MRNPLQLFVLFTLIAIGVVLGVMNPHAVAFYLPGRALTLPLSLVMALALVAGMLLVGISMLSSWLSWRWRLRKALREAKKCEDEKVRLRQQVHELRHALALSRADGQPEKKGLPDVRSQADHRP